MGFATFALVLAVAGRFIGALAAESTHQASWDSTEWDIIVVGAGPAGIIVADRMSEAGKRTLLVEGGGPSYGITYSSDEVIDRPAWLNGTNLSRVDVPGLYKSIFAPDAQGHFPLTCENYTNSFTGCAVGGSSAINAGLFFQPPASDFDQYFPDGWRYSDVKEAIARTYARVPSNDVYSENQQFYLQSGYDAARKWIVDSAGFENVNVNDQADRKSKVFGRPIFDYSNGQRGGPVTTYLQSSLNRSNFHLQTLTRVKRVALSGDTATGIVVFKNGEEKTINLTAGGRVILSGGALQSPQILMYSGVGDPDLRADLTAAGILNGVAGWIENRAVGIGLFDNPNTFIELEGSSISSYTYNYNDPVPSDAALYVQSHSGPYSFASETSAFWDLLNHTDGSVTAFQGTIDSSGYSGFNSNTTITLNIYGTSGLRSRGKVVLDRTKFLPGPSSDVYYSDPRDAEDIATFIRSIFDKLDSNLLTPKNIALNSTKDEIVRYITSATAYTRGEVNHWSSSCEIGKCVDSNTVVKGTKNVHVVDASILAPLTVNPQFGVMIAAEHASDLVLRLTVDYNTTAARNSSAATKSKANVAQRSTLRMALRLPTIILMALGLLGL